MRLPAAAVLSLSTACFVDPGLSGGATDSAASTEVGSGAEASGATGSTTVGSGSEGTTGVPGCAYSSDFSSAPVEWSKLTPTWSWDEASGLFVGQHGTGDVATRTTSLYSGAAPVDVVMTVRVRLKSGARAGVLLAASPTLSGDYVAVELDGIEQRVAVYVGDTQQVGVGTGFAAEAWIVLRVEFAGGQMAIELDGKPLATGLQFSGTFGDGPGLFVAEGAAEFDDVTICAASAK